MKRMLLVVLAAIAGTPLAAQQTRPGISVAEAPPMRQGAYIQIGGGAGMEQLDVENDAFGYSDELWEPTFNARAGAALHPNVRLGVDFNMWIRPDGDVTETASSVMPNLQIYLTRNAGLYIRGGAGYAWSSVSDNFYCCGSITYGGWGTNLGAGLEIPLSRTVAIGPTFDWYQYWISSGAIDYTERILSVGLGLTFQFR